MSNVYDPTITVCSKCKKASCWQGIFLCDDAYSAGTVKRKVSTLIKLDDEHPDYWNNDLNSANKPLLTPAILQDLGATGNKLELAEEPGTV
jgi:hypothetical protein